MKTIWTDVLILGSGLAGLCAAIACGEQGMDVLVCSKSGPGLGNCTTLSQGGFRNSSFGFSPDDHRRLTLAAGHGLNDMGKIPAFVNGAAAAVGKLKRYGVALQARETGFKSISQKIGQEGISITKPMVRHARSLGVRFLSPFFAWDIINPHGRAEGVWGFLKNENRPTIIRAKATVLAAGGGGALYSRTDNPPGITGDGYGMAYRAGLPLMDMEFVQFYPLGTAYPGKHGRFLPPILAEVGELLNAGEENLVVKYGISKRPLAVASRDTLSRAMALEVFNGRGVEGAIVLDLQNMDARWPKGKKPGSFHNESLKTWFEGYLGGRDSLPVMPVSHFCMGGVVTGEDCKTDLPGLYAAGEVVGGLHGANRHGGNALTEAAVFGDLAGGKAAEYAREADETGNRDLEPWVESRFKDIMKEYSEGAAGGGTDPARIKKSLQRFMWEHAGLIRSEGSLRAAREKVARYTPDKIKAGTVASFLQTKNMLLVASMVVEAALARKESRGAHFRIDYPRPDDAWIKHVTIRRGKETMVIGTL